jgi:hypothetical protein
MISLGLEPVTFQLVAQCLNHYTTTWLSYDIVGIIDLGRK